MPADWSAARTSEIIETGRLRGLRSHGKKTAFALKWLPRIFFVIDVVLGPVFLSPSILKYGTGGHASIIVSCISFVICIAISYGISMLQVVLFRKVFSMGESTISAIIELSTQHKVTLAILAVVWGFDGYTDFAGAVAVFYGRQNLTGLPPYWAPVLLSMALVATIICSMLEGTMGFLYDREEDK